MAFYSPSPGTRETRHVYDMVLALDAIERGDVDDEVTADLLDGYDPVWWMHALELLNVIRDAVEDEIVRCVSDARVDYDVIQTSSQTPSQHGTRSGGVLA